MYYYYYYYFLYITIFILFVHTIKDCDIRQLLQCNAERLHAGDPELVDL